MALCREQHHLPLAVKTEVAAADAADAMSESPASPADADFAAAAGHSWTPY